MTTINELKACANAASVPPELCVYSESSELNPEYLRSIATTKRFLEAYSSDSDFREGILAGHKNQFCQELNIDPQALRPLWDINSKEGDLTEDVRRYILFLREKELIKERLRNQECTPDNPAFKQWRQRQMNRFMWQVGRAQSAAVVHAPFAIELNQGCSVGCWFCGVDAPKLTKIFEYNASNAVLWRQILHHLHQRIGEGSKGGFCYWATDPFDNPDYEKFMSDFKNEFGRYPQTTTAQPLNNIERIKAFLKASSGKEKTINRFSVLSKNIMKKVFENYSPEDLLHVELIAQNSEGLSIKATAGRARIKMSSMEKEHQDDVGSSTIACVSGFLINMPAGSIKLISPCPASDQWPLGYRIYGEETFDQFDDFVKAIDRLMGKMKLDLKVDDPIQLKPSTSPYVEKDDLFITHNKLTCKLGGIKNPEAFIRLVELLRDSSMTVSEALIKLKNDLSMAETFNIIDVLFRSGIIDDAQFI
ncbi:radical SAM family RiPP maturation amino acid epimerase [Synechococcus sp. MIT S9504]|uniref:radical SAM family RiPP maturation amino acid epimerase n=1 Tax=Synechococcus sp. MIT S9504 TaxID=1801628 RepID=UPI0007BAF487|nr:radical SAM family RiPP maturation amino acid epimerase [Synechococcus sp. MIT S9504]KZR85843.1 hypothetical protein MITS9504_01626 [Synechococcus sp. MIT S9504]